MIRTKSKYFISLVFLLAASNYSFADSQYNIDSLFQVLKTSKEDTLKVINLKAIGKEFIKAGRIDDAKKYLDEGLLLAEKLNYSLGQLRILNNIAYIYKLQNNDSTALKYYFNSVKIADEHGYKEEIAFNYLAIGNIYTRQTNFPEALRILNKGLNIYKEIGNNEGISSVYTNIGNIYLTQDDLVTALDYYISSLKINEEIGDKTSAAMNMNNIGLIYNKQDNYIDALKNYKSAVKIFEELDDKNNMSGCYNNIGSIYYRKLDKYQEGLSYFAKALRICDELGDKSEAALYLVNIANLFKSYYKKYPVSRDFKLTDSKNELKVLSAGNLLDSSIVIYKIAYSTFNETKNMEGIIASLIGIGEYYELKNNSENTIKYFNQAYHFADSLNFLFPKQEISMELFQYYKKNNDYKNSLIWHEKYMENKDSLFGQNKAKEQARILFKYDSEQKEAAAKAEQLKKDAVNAAELSRQRMMRNGFTGGFAIVLVFAGVLFRQRNKTRKEKQRSDDLLLNILPEQTANELKETGVSKAKAYTMATVMFTDFKDFTTISEKVSAELLVDEIHACFSAFDTILKKYKIEKIKTIGDAYLCASGLPVPNFTHAIDMINAAIEIRDFMLKRKNEKTNKGEISFELRIGIHTGPLVAGIVGINKFAYDIWGDTVNLAARMEQNSEAGKINISGSTFTLVKDLPNNKFHCIHRGRIEAKNKGLVDMYFVEVIV